MTLLTVQGLTHHYAGGVPALAGIDLTIHSGQSLAIVGANGAGKTTLLLHLNGILRPSGGLIQLDGRDVAYDKASLLAWRRRVGLVLQDADDQLFAASVAEDVSFGPLNLGLSEAEAGQRVRAALLALGLADLADRPPHMLSFGQKKRVAIAGAVAMQPEILLLDEPTAGLDAAGTTALLAVMAQLQAAGTTLVFTTHDADMAYEFAQQVAVFHQGRVLAQGATQDIFSDRALLTQAGLAVPLILDFALKARQLGLMPASDPLPRNRGQMLDMVTKFAG